MIYDTSSQRLVSELPNGFHIRLDGKWMFDDRECNISFRWNKLEKQWHIVDPANQWAVDPDEELTYNTLDDCISQVFSEGCTFHTEEGV